MDRDNVKLIEEFNTLKYENKKLKEKKRTMEMYIEFVLGPENYQKMLRSIGNDAIMGRIKKSKKPTGHKRRVSGHQPKMPTLGDSRSMQSLQSARPNKNNGFDSHAFKKILHEFDKNKQNANDQNEMMDDLQRKMALIGKEFNMKKGANLDLQFETQGNTPLSLNSGSQTHQIIHSNSANSDFMTNIVPASGRSSDIRAQAQIESDLYSTQRESKRRDSLPIIQERD